MPRTAVQLKLAYAGLAAADTWLSGLPRGHRLRFLTKPLLMPTLTASLLTDPRAAGSPLRATAVAGQLGGWGGDMALMGSGTKPFLAGMGSFALGHAAYIAGFLRRRGRSSLVESPGPRAIAVAWGLSAVPMAVMAGRRQRELGLPVLGYATLLSLMTASAVHLDESVPPSARRLTGLGATLFMVSDSILGFAKFVIGDPAPQLERAVMASYTAAQLLISEGAARA